MRGNHSGAKRAAAEPGSIPAYAGEPPGAARGTESGWVYPRVCGGTIHIARVPAQETGLSPRMRGNRADCRRRIAALRSIPAYAGEPGPSALAGGILGVYPRVCGGTIGPDRAGSWRPGLSPRMRGNLPVSIPAAVVSRSIPAYAGEPPRFRIAGPGFSVYPRVCGGTGR